MLENTIFKKEPGTLGSHLLSQLTRRQRSGGYRFKASPGEIVGGTLSWKKAITKWLLE
jgi:hypothetical protein